MKRFSLFLLLCQAILIVIPFFVADSDIVIDKNAKTGDNLFLTRK